MSYSKGIMWLDDCRIPFVDEGDTWVYPNGAGGNTFHGQDRWDIKVSSNQQGRFTPNLLVSDNMLNDGVISKSTIFDGKLPNIKGGRFGAIDVELTDKRAFGGYSDKGTNSRYYDLDLWFDKMLERL